MGSLEETHLAVKLLDNRLYINIKYVFYAMNSKLFLKLHSTLLSPSGYSSTIELIMETSRYCVSYLLRDIPPKKSDILIKTQNFFKSAPCYFEEEVMTKKSFSLKRLL